MTHILNASLQKRADELIDTLGVQTHKGSLRAITKTAEKRLDPDPAGKPMRAQWPFLSSSTSSCIMFQSHTYYFLR